MQHGFIRQALRRLWSLVGRFSRREAPKSARTYPRQRCRYCGRVVAHYANGNAYAHHARKCQPKLPLGSDAA